MQPLVPPARSLTPVLFAFLVLGLTPSAATSQHLPEPILSLEAAVTLAEVRGAAQSVEPLQVEREARPRPVGALIGAGVIGTSGAVAGAVTFAGLNALRRCDPRSPDPEERWFCFRTGDALLLGGMIGAYYGVPAGAVYGFIFPGERRVREPSPATRTRLAVRADGRVAIGSGVSF